VWFSKGLPSRIGHLLDISLRELEAVLYFGVLQWLSIQATPVKERSYQDETVSESDQTRYRPSGFKAMIGAGRSGVAEACGSAELAIELRRHMKTGFASRRS